MEFGAAKLCFGTSTMVEELHRPKMVEDLHRPTLVEELSRSMSVECTGNSNGREECRLAR